MRTLPVSVKLRRSLTFLALARPRLFALHHMALKRSELCLRASWRRRHVSCQLDHNLAHALPRMQPVLRSRDLLQTPTTPPYDFRMCLSALTA